MLGVLDELDAEVDFVLVGVELVLNTELLIDTVTGGLACELNMDLTLFINGYLPFFLFMK